MDFELYGRYIIPIQIGEDFTRIIAENEEKIQRLISTLLLFERYFWMTFNGCPCDECRKRNNFDFQYRWEDIDSGRIDKVTKAIGTGKSYTYCERTLPTWFYYRDYRRRIAIIESESLAEFIRSLVPDKSKTVNGIHGDIYITNEFKYSLEHKIKAKIKGYFKKLDDTDPEFLLFEDKILACGTTYILSVDSLCGLHEYQQEKQRIRERHIAEFQLLFNNTRFNWSDKIDPSLFEDLVKDLLEREPAVLRVRKMANTRERDGGTDLTVEWNVLKQRSEMTETDQSPYKKINVVAQCKAYKKAIGKSDVLDIRDTVDARNYGGYFLAVAGYMKKSLTDYLDKLRNSDQIWVDWWTRSEIEDRLRKHEDLLIKYKTIAELA